MIDIQINNPFFSLDYLKIDFEWFTTCDRNCSYCYNVANGEKRYSRSTEEIKTVLDKLLHMKKEKLVISLLGGEILLSKDFNEIIEFIIDNCKPTHKFLVFTHGQHDPLFFENKMKSLIPLGEQVRVIQSIHFEDINKENFEINAQYISKNFKHKSFVVFPDGALKENIEWFDKLVKDNPKTSIEPLIYDLHSKEYIDILKYKSYIEQLKLLLEPYNDRSEMKYLINGTFYKGIEAKRKIQLDYGYKFKNMNCVLRVYEIRKNGDVYNACADTFGKILNIKTCSMEELNEKIKIQTIRCPFEECEPNLCALKVYS